jgi:hypothetical protein
MEAEDVDAPSSARPLVPSATQIVDATDQPDGRARVGTAAATAEVTEDMTAARDGFW